MKWFTGAVVYIMSWLLGSLMFPQIIGSLRKIKLGLKMPYIITFIIWVAIGFILTFVVYLCLRKYLTVYIVALAIPFVLTLCTKHIE